jgi:hypothetical protein
MSMGDVGGAILSFAGAIVSFWVPPLGIAMMIAGGVWSQQIAARKMQEAMDAAAKARAGMKTNARTSQMAIPVAYGKVRIGGNLVYMNTGGPLVDNEQQNLDLAMVLGMSEGPIESFEEVWFNDKKVYNRNPGDTTIEEGFTGEGPAGRFALDFRLGCNSQAIFDQIRNLSPSGGFNCRDQWTTPADTEYNDRMPLTALMFVKLNNWTNRGKDPSVWQGIPQITATVKGKRIRSLGDLNTLAWSDNPAEVLFDTMTNPVYGWGLPSSKIDLASFISAASWCAGSGTVDVSTVTHVMTGPSGNAPRYWTEAATVAPIANAVLNFSPSSWWAHQDVTSAVRFPMLANSLRIYTTVGTEVWSYVDSSNGAICRVGGVSTPACGPNSPIACGSVNYATGSISIMGSGEWVSSPSSAMSNRWTQIVWPQGWGGNYNLPNQFLGNSLTIRCGSELLQEVASGTLLSNSGGWAKVNYTQGIVDFSLFSVQSGVPIEATYVRRSHTGYSFNGYIMDSVPVIDRVREICGHFRGYLVYSQGVYSLKIDRPGVAIHSFDEDNIRAGTFSVSQAPLSERPNRVRVKYTDATNNYTPADVLYEPSSPALPIALAINEEVLSLPYLTFKEEAMRMAKTHANQRQLGLNVEFEVGFDGMAVEPGDLMNVTHSSVGFQDKKFRVISTEETSEETVKLSGIEYDPNVYADEYL